MKKNFYLILLGLIFLTAAAGFFLWRLNSFGKMRESTKVDFSKTAKIGVASQATKIIRYIPPNVDRGKEKTGDCFAQSMAAPGREDAWRCKTAEDNIIYDPCFVLPGANKAAVAVCNADPVSNGSGFNIKLAQAPLFADQPKNVDSAWAWFLQLDGGAFCVRFQDGQADIGRLPATYSCGGGENNLDVIVGEINSEAPFWTVQAGKTNSENGDIEILNIKNVSVLKAWQ